MSRGKINKIGTVTSCKTISYGAECPGIESFHPGFQYLVSTVCQLCVVKNKFNENVAFNVHFCTLSFYFNSNI
jgi:hypothetical protein